MTTQTTPSLARLTPSNARHFSKRADSILDRVQALLLDIKGYDLSEITTDVAGEETKDLENALEVAADSLDDVKNAFSELGDESRAAEDKAARKAENQKKQSELKEARDKSRAERRGKRDQARQAREAERDQRRDQKEADRKAKKAREDAERAAKEAARAKTRTGGDAAPQASVPTNEPVAQAS